MAEKNTNTENTVNTEVKESKGKKAWNHVKQHGLDWLIGGVGGFALAIGGVMILGKSLDSQPVVKAVAEAVTETVKETV